LHFQRRGDGQEEEEERQRQQQAEVEDQGRDSLQTEGGCSDVRASLGTPQQVACNALAEISRIPSRT